MKKYTLYLSGLLCLLLACNSREESGSNVSPEQYNDTPTMKISEEVISILEREDITVNELPSNISQNLRKDDFFSSLDLVQATKIQEKSRTYYDLTFEDEENQTIMAAFDENGNIVPL